MTSGVLKQKHDVYYFLIAGIADCFAIIEAEDRKVNFIYLHPSDYEILTQCKEYENRHIWEAKVVTTHDVAEGYVLCSELELDSFESSIFLGDEYIQAKNRSKLN